MRNLMRKKQKSNQLMITVVSFFNLIFPFVVFNHVWNYNLSPDLGFPVLEIYQVILYGLFFKYMFTKVPSSKQWAEAFDGMHEPTLPYLLFNAGWAMMIFLISVYASYQT